MDGAANGVGGLGQATKTHPHPSQHTTSMHQYKTRLTTLPKKNNEAKKRSVTPSHPPGKHKARHQIETRLLHVYAPPRPPPLNIYVACGVRAKTQLVQHLVFTHRKPSQMYLLFPPLYLRLPPWLN